MTSRLRLLLPMDGAPGCHQHIPMPLGSGSLSSSPCAARATVTCENRPCPAPQPAELWPFYRCSQRLLASSPHHLSAQILRRITRSLPGGPSEPCADFRPLPPPTLSSGATCTTHPPRPPPWIPLREWRHPPPSGQLPKQPLGSHPGLLPLCTMASCS